MSNFIKSKSFRIATIAVGAFLIALIIFALGVNVGLHKARFSSRFGENYERNFISPHQIPDGRNGMMRPGLFPDFGGKDLRNAHGVAGIIISITDNNLIIKDRDNKENTVAVNEKTIIKYGRDTIKITDLKNDEQAVVIGKPGDNGVINADLIRIFNGN